MEKYQYFDGDRFVAEKVASLCSTHEIEHVIETGTASGVSTRFLAGLAKRVVTIEKDQEMFDRGGHLSELPNVFRRLGDSRKALAEAITPGVRTLFYLDGHDFYESPILDEIRALKACGSGTFVVVVVHDFKVPGTSLGFNTSTTLGGDGAISLENLAGVLGEVFRLYEVEHNSEATADGARRGVAYIKGCVR